MHVSLKEMRAYHSSIHLRGLNIRPQADRMMPFFCLNQRRISHVIRALNIICFSSLRGNFRIKLLISCDLVSLSHLLHNVISEVMIICFKFYGSL